MRNTISTITKSVLFGLAMSCFAQTIAAQPAMDPAVKRRIERVLAQTPLIDGHNDLPWEIRAKHGSALWSLDLSGAAGTPITQQETDIVRMRAGQVGAQFWSVWIPVSVTGAEAIKMALEQIDVVRGFPVRYPNTFAQAYTAADIQRVHRSGKIANLIGIEGGHQIGGSIAALRQFYGLGVRYMTLTHSSNNELADSATDNPKHNGLSPFGVAAVKEMNRLGMLVDLSHVSPDTMRQAIAVSKAPVIFSHSNARAILDHSRNVPDDVLLSLKERDGIVMVNFFSGYLSPEYNQWLADKAAETARFNSPPFGGLYIGQPERAAAALEVWAKAHPRPVVNLTIVADHIDHIVKIAGIDHVGIGSDFDGVDAEVPIDLRSVADYPNLFAELIRRGWTDDMLGKLAGGNLLRVMRKAETVAASLASEPLANLSVSETQRVPN
jgi:membrane dipeptidase